MDNNELNEAVARVSKRVWLEADETVRFMQAVSIILGAALVACIGVWIGWEVWMWARPS